jgi:hypothetical protein
MSTTESDELVAEMKAAAASLVTAAAAAENGDFAAAEIGLEDAMFRTQHLMARIQQVQLVPRVDPRPSETGQG